MNRDERILQALADGATSAVEVAERTGLPLRTVQHGLRYLVKPGHVSSPERGSYRLTALGEAALARPAQEPMAPERPSDPADDRPLLGLDPRFSHIIAASPLVGSTAAPRPAPVATATSDDRLVDDRTAHDDDETTVAADAGTFGRGTVAAVVGVVIVGVVAVWKGQAVLAALGTAGTPQRDEAPRQAAVVPGLDARREAMEYQPALGMAPASTLGGYTSGLGGGW